MVSKIEKNCFTMLESNDLAQNQKRSMSKTSHGYMAKVLRTAVGYLAVSQGFGSAAAARPVGEVNALAAPMSRNASLPVVVRSVDKVSEHASPIFPKDSFNTSMYSLNAQLTPVTEENTPSEAHGRRALLSTMNTYIVNHSNAEIIATTSHDCFSYCNDPSGFINAEIEPGGTGHDYYCPQSSQEATFEDVSLGRRGQSAGVGFGCAPRIGVHIRGGAWRSVTDVHLDPDESIIVMNTPNQGTLDIFKAKYGSLSQTDGFLGLIIND